MLSNDRIEVMVSEAVAYFWKTRDAQFEKQHDNVRADYGSRSAVTGGKQLDGFINLIKAYLVEAGVNSQDIFTNRALELPGFYRPTKQWDLLVVSNRTLIAAMELKSQAGPSFGNNFNNRTEEAMGSAVDIWKAFEKGIFSHSQQPWLGYLMMLEHCESSICPVKAAEPHFKIFPEFHNASYLKRYALFCQKLVLERLYTKSCFITTSKTTSLKDNHYYPNSDLDFVKFLHSLLGYVQAYMLSL